MLSLREAYTFKLTEKPHRLRSQVITIGINSS